MVKCCSAPGCSSGTVWDRKARKKANGQLLSLFSVPKDSERLGEWKKVFPNLPKWGCLCELHFLPEDVISNYAVTLPNNDVFEQEKKSLKLHAVPIILCIKDSSVIEKHKACGSVNIQKSESILNNRKRKCSSSSDRDLESVEIVESMISFNNDSGSFLPEKQTCPEINLGDMLQAFIDTKETWTLPETWTYFQYGKEVHFMSYDFYNDMKKVYLVLSDDMTFSIRAQDKTMLPTGISVHNIEDVIAYLRRFNKFITCCGSKNGRDGSCIGYVASKDGDYIRQIQQPRCRHCRDLQKKVLDKQYARLHSKKSIGNYQHKLHVVKRRLEHAKHKISKLETEITTAREECAQSNKEALMSAITVLPALQQEAVRMCFEASQTKGRKGMRYNLQWIYECILMRIKSSALYEHLRNNGTLALPHKATLQKYIRRITGSSYGFQNEVFNCMKQKGGQMNPSARRGTLIVDEMSLSEAIAFNRKTMKFNGFVDLGAHTPESQKNTRADHALVFMFQPFQGRWVQVLGCFLSKNSVNSEVLQKLLVECIILLGNSGFQVDVVTSDGAQWNRGVWTKMGINADNPSCAHPCDVSKRLFMMSDFPHLIKCFRNSVLNRESFKTSHGVVKINHWRALIDLDKPDEANLSLAYKLSWDHLNPEGYQKMNVPMAFQVFDERVAIAMKLRSFDHPALHDSTPTQQLIIIVSELIEAMMSRKPLEAMRCDADGTCKRKEVNSP